VKASVYSVLSAITGSMLAARRAGMSETRKRVLFYLLLAIACYSIAAYLGGGRIAFIVFIVAGLIAELVFWTHLFVRVRQWLGAR